MMRPFFNLISIKCLKYSRALVSVQFNFLFA